MKFWLDTDIIIRDEIFGFRRQHKITLQLLRVTKYITNNLNSNTATRAILLNLQKAVWPSGLVYKFTKLRVSNWLTRIAYNILSDRSFSVRIIKFLYDLAILSQQCSPTLFKLYINDIPTNLFSHLAFKLSVFNYYLVVILLKFKIIFFNFFICLIMFILLVTFTHVS